MRTVDRIAAVLRAVSMRSPDGLGLAELASQCGLDRATTLRLTRALVNTGWLQRDAQSGRYLPGVEAWLAGRFSSPARDKLLRAGAAALKALSRSTGDTVYLAIRSGPEVVCLARVDGAHPIGAKMKPGQRHRLGVGATGLALLASLHPDEREQVLAALHAYDRRGLDLAAMRAQFRRRDQDGYVLASGTVFYRVPAIGMEIQDATGTAVAAISLGADQERLDAARIEALVPLMRKARLAIERGLRKP